MAAPVARRSLLAGSATLLAAPALAAGPKLNAIGSDEAGNAAGTIPPWTGGLRAPVAGRFDPFADDPVLARLRAAQADDPALPAGLAALLRARPTLFLRVMPTRRPALLPDDILRASEANLGQARLSDDGRTVTGARIGIPFPRPANGTQAIWNHMLRWRFAALRRRVVSATPLASGAFTLIRYEDRTLYPYNLPQGDATASQLLSYVVTAPALYARLALLSRQPLDYARERTSYWFWVPSDRKLAFSADTAFDVPNGLSDGIRLVDNADVFAGSPERYAWTLHGKREAILPYNSYGLYDPARRYTEILLAGGLNPNLLRYERRRAWLVEARLRPGQSHRFPRRVFWLDEDSWQALLVEHYDDGGRLARVTEAHPIQFFDPPSLYASVDVVHDLASGRYGVFGLMNEEPPMETSAPLTAADFTPDAFRATVSR